MFGFIVLNKPSGISSRQAIDKLNRIVYPAKIGHAGTLDPLANGVLVACIGPATRLVQFVQDLPKHYLGSFRLGCESPTEDIESDLVPVEGAPEIKRAELESVLPEFTGTIEQVPPQFSALKVDGRRAYKSARQGKKVELKPRTIAIHSLELTEFAYPDFQMLIRCGSGTYVRSLGRDIGRAVGSGAVMTALTRSAIGPFTLDRALNPDELTPEIVEESVIPAADGLAEFPQVTVSDRQQENFLNGVPIRLETPAASTVAAIDSHRRLIAVLVKKKATGLYAPSINFAHYWAEQNR